jgi:hypothetical protein
MTMKKENWRILTNMERYAMVKKPTTTEKIRLNRLFLVWVCIENGRK